MKLAYIYSPQHTAALVRNWIERGETAEHIEQALIDKLNENYAAIDQAKLVERVSNL
jgi:hypothetical protein